MPVSWLGPPSEKQSGAVSSIFGFLPMPRGKGG